MTRETASLPALLTALVRFKIEIAYLHVRRRALARIAEKLSTDLLEDVRVAVTEELAHRGLFVIAPRPRSQKVA
jgi:hypothetical protein